ncbi:MAG TPA: hypothetical protein VE178_04180, partial [Silvibacterium sp.]|nr:hypothetical protein [Silvibacterium sp.]
MQYRCLALASLIITASFAAHPAPAEPRDPQPAFPDISLPAPTLPPVVLAAENVSGTPLAGILPVTLPAVSLPDDPSAAQQQGTANDQQPAQAQPATQQPQGPLSAQEQLKIQEKQRVLGVMAAFNTTSNRDAVPLTPGQKFQLFFKSQTDPWPFGLAAVIAGINQATNAFPEYGQGVQGYAKRFGVAYGDAFIGNFFGNAVLTSLWHEDPRYFQKGTGSYTSRFLWAATATVWCKRDNGTWGPNYANVAGNLIGAAIANVYYPESERTAWDTVSRGLTVSAEGIIGAEIIEFWPDILRRYQR